MAKAERFVIYPLLALLGLAVFGDLGLGRRVDAGESNPIGRFSKVVTEELVVLRKGGSVAAGVVGTEQGGALYVLDAKGRDAAELSARNGFGYIGLWAPPAKDARIEIFAGAPNSNHKYPAHIRIFDGAVYVANRAKSAETLVLPGFVEARRDGKVLLRMPSQRR